MKTRMCMLSAALSLVVLAGCSDREAAQAARAQAQADANAAAAGQAEAAFNAAVEEENWALAKAQADVLLARWPGTDAADRVQASYDEVKSKGDAANEARRTEALWAYNTEAVKGGNQLSAAIYAKDPLDVDGTGRKPVRLIFRDHPDWGRSSYLVLQAGDFAQACYRNCRVTVTVDDGTPRRMAAHRPKTEEAIAMFIDDEKAMWALTRDAKVVQVTFATRAAGDQTAVFEVAGLDRTKLPGWD
ncbi:hypothetical protein E2F46_13415 [Luteimonas aestuarii]|uniref:Lipoprotein n=1 Tax=Luteimonas aestuarii TaxID=453837 RepID=A0A4R5TQL2_9GAMM|nr:hypothetical protein [Luteimonas aestuarii]TDK22750.1 hypothetical protein E2F46_13415 [Luteimonas aestuarii]